MTARRADPASVGAGSGRSPEQTAAGGDVKERAQPSRALNQGEQSALGEQEFIEIQRLEGRRCDGWRRIASGGGTPSWSAGRLLWPWNVVADQPRVMEADLLNDR